MAIHSNKNLPRPARVWLALKRCSRDKWLSPEALYKTAYSFSVCINPTNPSATMSAAVQGRIDVQSSVAVGMINGFSAFQPHDPGFFEFRDYLKKYRSPKAPPIELVILKIKLKTLKEQK